MSEETDTPALSAEPAFTPAMSGNDDGPGNGPPWHQPFVKASLYRIRSAPTAEAVQAQASVEAVILLHSIRRILVWTAVIIPTALLAISIILLVAASNAGSSSTSCPYTSISC